MTKEQFKEYICKQIDLMDESQLEEFSVFVRGESEEEHVAEELIVIRGELKKLTRLIQSTEQKFEVADKIYRKEQLKTLMEFDAFLKNSKDAVDSLPEASIFSISKTNRSIRSLKDGFSSVDRQYEKILDDAGLERCAEVGERFDPDRHEAVETIDNKSLENETITEVLEDGFLYGDEIINYAKVKVNRWIS